MKKIALLVIDVQNNLVLKNPFNIDEIIKNIKILIEISRKNNVEVIYIQHNGKEGSEIAPYSDGWQIYDDIKPNSNEQIIFKNYPSSFKETNLHEYLKTKKINELIITGMQTDYCIDTTVKVAFENGFKLIIPEKTNTTFDNDNILAENLYNHYNFNIFNKHFGFVEPVEITIKRLENSAKL